MRIIHLLQWHILDIMDNLEAIKEQNFDTIQISPMQDTKEPYNNDFWVLYQPTNFKIGNNQIGSKENLKKLCLEAKRLNLNIVVDVVLRHVANDNYNWLKPHSNVDSEIKMNSDFFCNVGNITDYSNRYQCINLANNLPLLNYRNEKLQDIYLRYLNELKECGVGGFRIDMAKHFALPCEDCNFFSRVFGTFKDMIIYGEVLDATKEIVDLYSELMLVATNSFGSNRDRLVTWVESHDDYLTFGFTRKMTKELINEEYALLCREYKNTIYYVRPYTDYWKDPEIRNSNNI